MFDFEDLDIFFAGFGQKATIKLDYNEIDVLFFNPTKEIHQLEQLNTDPLPFILAKTSDVTDLRRDVKLEINDIEYYVQDIEPDGTGMTKITLMKVTYVS